MKARGVPGFWKFNATLVDDQEYCDSLHNEYKNWLEEFEAVKDKRVLWDLIKYKIRQYTITYSKAKARKKREKLNLLGRKFKKPVQKNVIRTLQKKIWKNSKFFKRNMIAFTDYITQGAIIRSRAN